MKRKLFLISLLTVILVCIFTLSVSAATSVTDDATDEVTLGACTINGVDSSIIPAPTVGLEYSLDDETMTATITGRGTFEGGNLAIPSSVTYGGKTYAVTTINSKVFYKMTINLYVPDSVKTIKGGSQSGCFGDSTIDTVYIGSGLTRLEQETFSGSKGFNTFVCKSKLTYVGKYAFNECDTTAATLGAYEFDLSSVTYFEEYAFNGSNFLRTDLVLNENVTFIGSHAFISCSRLTGSNVVVPANCTLGTRCFNGTSLKRVIIETNKGETRLLPTEMFSGASGGLTLIFTGDVLANGNHVLSGNSMNIYTSTEAQIQAFANSIIAKDGKDRIGSVTFYACKDGKSFKSSSAGVLTMQEENIVAHAYGTELVHFEKNCSNYEKYAYVCAVCGYQDVKSQGNEYGEHAFVSTTKAPTCQSIGYTEYVCTACDHKETAHIAPKSSHNPSIVTYAQPEGEFITATYTCEYCNGVVSSETISLVNKCYIEGYGLFDATMDYVSVNADGLLTPGSATFNNAKVYFPSYVKVNGETVKVTTIQGFNRYSIKSIYVPDTVTRLVGGSNVGCFGNITTLKNVVVGKGVTVIEQEIFSSSGMSFDEFIFKGVITEIHKYAFNHASQSSADIPYEFNTYLSYVGYQVNVEGNIIREAYIKKGCNLSEKFAFNNANGLKTVYIEGGDTPETALDLGQEFTSNKATVNYYIKGYVTVSGQAVIAGQNNTRIYMSSQSAIDYFTAAIKKQGYSERLDKAIFMDCGTGTAWYVAYNADRAPASTAYSHGGVFTDTDSTCTVAGATTSSCFVCGKVISSTTKELTEHTIDGGVITKMPTANEAGTIVFTCLTCGKTDTHEIPALSDVHVSITHISYPNGFDKAGVESIICSKCGYNAGDSALAPIFVNLGTSISDDKTDITIGFKVNREALAYYEEMVSAIEFGFIVASADDVSEKGALLNEDLEIADGVRGFMATFATRQFSYINVKVCGATTEANRKMDFVLAVYVIDNTQISFVQHSLTNGNKPVTAGDYILNTISIDRAYEDKKNN